MAHPDHGRSLGLSSYASKKDKKNDNSKQAPSTYRKSIEGATKIKVGHPRQRFREFVTNHH